MNSGYVAAAIVVLSVGIGGALVVRAGQTQAAQTASLSGRVIDGSTGRPIAGAQVTLMPYSGRMVPAAPAVVADDNGQFTLNGLAGGAYRVNATAGGYRASFAGALAPTDSAAYEAIEIASGEKRAGITIRMWRAAVISGSVRDAAGQPVVRANVSALRRTDTCGLVRLSSTASTTTDDRGMYRLADLAPNDYLVGVRGNATSTVARSLQAVTTIVPSVYYPGNVEPQSKDVFPVGAGEERQNVDITVPSGKLTIAGLLLEPDGTPSTKRVDLLTSDDGVSVDWPIARTIPKPDGRFQFAGLPAGRYVVRVVEFPAVPPGAVTQMGAGFTMLSADRGRELSPVPDQPTIWAERTVELRENDVDLGLRLQSGWRIRGRVAVDGLQMPAELTAGAFVLAFRFDYASLGSMQAARVERDGTFVTVAVPTGRYKLMLMPYIPSQTPPPRALALAAIRHAGQNITGFPIEVAGDVSDVTIEMTERPPDITGTVEAGPDLTNFGARAYVFPTNERAWSACSGGPIGFQVAQVRDDGTFKVRSLPPGEYFVAAAYGTEPEWHRTEFLRSLVPSAARVRVALGDHATVRIKPRPRR